MESKLNKIKEVCAMQSKNDDVSALLDLVNEFLFSNIGGFPDGYVKTQAPLELTKISEANPMLNAGLSNLVDNIRIMSTFALIHRNPQTEGEISVLVDYCVDLGIGPQNIGFAGYIP